MRALLITVTDEDIEIVPELGAASFGLIGKAEPTIHVATWAEAFDVIGRFNDIDLVEVHQEAN